MKFCVCGKRNKLLNYDSDPDHNLAVTEISPLYDFKCLMECDNRLVGKERHPLSI